ncbi:MAG: ferredoxin family protein [Hyphomicrobiales bacterium]|nr:ferredoxin family protein [Hyphomicrobiales bacterium]
MIELISADRCICCDACVDACPDDVFDRTTSGVPAIGRLDDCQTCFLCELYCPADAIYVSPFKDAREKVDEAALMTRGLIGSYRRFLGWRGIKASGVENDLSHRLPEPDGTPWER